MTTLAGRPGTALLVVDVQAGVVAEAHERDARRRQHRGARRPRARRGRAGRLGPAPRRAVSPTAARSGRSRPSSRRPPASRSSRSSTATPSRTPTWRPCWQQRGVGRLVVIGAETDACIRSTLHGAIVRGYDATLVGRRAHDQRPDAVGRAAARRRSSRTRTSTGPTTRRPAAPPAPSPPRTSASEPSSAPDGERPRPRRAAWRRRRASARTRAGTFRPTGVTSVARPSRPTFARATGHQPKRSRRRSCSTTVAPGDAGVTSARTVAPPRLRRRRRGDLPVEHEQRHRARWRRRRRRRGTSRSRRGVTVALNVPSSAHRRRADRAEAAAAVGLDRHVGPRRERRAPAEHERACPARVVGRRRVEQQAVDVDLAAHERVQAAVVGHGADLRRSACGTSCRRPAGPSRSCRRRR